MWLFVFLTACSVSDAGKGAPGDRFADTAASESDTGDLDTSDTPSLSADAWTVRADVTVAGGVPVADGAVILVDAVDSAAQQVVCTIEAELATVASDEAPDEAEIWAWWGTAEVPAGDCASLPAQVSVGIGALDRDVRARLGADGMDDVADSLYGAFVRGDGGVYTFGYAGADENLAGTAAPSDPPPDGDYHLAPLYLLSL
jgi:hypothetical protein